jgi:ribosomal protein S8
MAWPTWKDIEDFYSGLAKNELYVETANGMKRLITVLEDSGYLTGFFIATSHASLTIQRGEESTHVIAIDFIKNDTYQIYITLPSDVQPGFNIVNLRRVSIQSILSTLASYIEEIE